MQKRTVADTAAKTNTGTEEPETDRDMIRKAEIGEVVAEITLLAVEEKMRHAEIIDQGEIATVEDIVLIRTIEEGEEAVNEVAVDREALRGLRFASGVRRHRRGALLLLGCPRKEVATRSHREGGHARRKETVPTRQLRPNQLSSNRIIKTHTSRPKRIRTNHKNEVKIATWKAPYLRNTGSGNWRLRCHKTVLMQMLRPQQVKQMGWHHRKLAHGSGAKNKGSRSFQKTVESMIMVLQSNSGTTSRRATTQASHLLTTVLQKMKKHNQVLKPLSRQARKISRSSAPPMQVSKNQQLQMEKFRTGFVS